MRHRGRPLLLLLIGIISLIALAALIYFVSPNLSFGPALLFPNLSFPLEKFVQIPTTILFFILFSIFIFCTSSYILKSKTHGVLITGFLIIYLIFRLTHLTNPFFLILLLALFVTLELFVSNRRD
jgi:hypothetical protein